MQLRSTTINYETYVCVIVFVPEYIALELGVSVYVTYTLSLQV